jgi:RND family efflux transporter MFP subunit
MRWLIPVVAAVVGLVIGAAVMWAFAGGSNEPDAPAPPPEMEGPPASVRVGVVEYRTLQNRVPLNGRLQEVRRVTVTSEIEGKIVEVRVDQGDRVMAGDEPTVLATIDDTWAKLAQRSAEASVAEAKARVRQAEADLKQLESLQQAGSAKSKEVEDQRTLLDANRAQLQAAQATLDRAAQELERATIVAPFDGAISQKIAEVGQWVAAGDPVVEMISTGEIDALINVPERYIGGFAIGDPVEVQLDAVGLTLTGQIAAVRPDAQTASRSYPVKVRLKDPEGQLKTGMSAIVYLPNSAKREFITVPRDAVLMTDLGAQVWFAMDPAMMSGGPPPTESDASETERESSQKPGPTDVPISDGPPPMPLAMSEPVEVLFGDGDRYAVEPLPGAKFPALNPGTQVVIEGAERLWPTRRLIIMNSPDPSQPPPPAEASGKQS